jgi:hypothetical protein
MRGETIAAAQKAAIIHDKAELLALSDSSRTNIGNVSTLDAPSPPSTRCGPA